MAAILGAVVALLGFVFTLGVVKAKTDSLAGEVRAARADISKCWAKIEGLNGRRLEGIEAEVKRLRDWRHRIENDRLGERLHRRLEEE